jgi:hypothetical protein
MSSLDTAPLAATAISLHAAAFSRQAAAVATRKQIDAERATADLVAQQASVSASAPAPAGQGLIVDVKA